MQLTGILGQMGGLQSMARELGVSVADTHRGAQALLPAIMGGFKKQAQAQPSGIEGLGGLLGQLGGGGQRQQRAGADLWLQGREPQPGCKCGFAVGSES